MNTGTQVKDRRRKTANWAARNDAVSCQTLQALTSVLSFRLVDAVTGERERERDCVCVGGTGARASAGHWRLRGVREQSVGRLLVDGRHASHVTSAACQPGRRARACHC